MTADNISHSDRSIKVGGHVTGGSLVSGDNNTVSIQFRQATLPQLESVDIQAELKALQVILSSLNDPVATGVAQKLTQEANKPKPDKGAIAATLETGLTYAQNLSGFAETIDNLRPHIEAVAGWLGKHGYGPLPLVGLVL